MPFHLTPFLNDSGTNPNLVVTGIRLVYDEIELKISNVNEHP